MARKQPEFKAKYLIIMEKNTVSKFLKHFPPLPFLFAGYIFFFHYANNAEIVDLISSIELFFILTLITLAILLLFEFIFKLPKHKSSFATLIFLLFFLTYGIFYDGLIKLDIVQVEHYTFLQLFLLIALYSSLGINHIPQNILNSLDKVFSIIFGGLIVFNLIKILPVEIKKIQLDQNTNQQNLSMQGSQSSGNSIYPDIYYFVFDEAAGFNVIKDYFKYDEIIDFENYLTETGFFIAEESQSSTTSTLYEMASRLNFKEYSYPGEKLDYFEAISKNQVMAYLQNKGYSIGVLSELGSPLAYPTMPSIQADYSFFQEAENIELGSGDSSNITHLVLAQTMLRPFSDSQKLENTTYRNHKANILFAQKKVGELEEIKSPKFIYIHLLIPHKPFLFDAQGNINYSKYLNNWNYYLGNYIFSMSLAKNMIQSVINDSYSSNPPVIILQSDHGARNNKSPNEDFVPLENYPEEYKTHIINALYLPVCPQVQLSKDIDPVNTFPIVFNCLFDDNLPIR